MARPHSQSFRFAVLGWVQEFAFLTNSQVKLKLQIQGPHFENISKFNNIDFGFRLPVWNPNLMAL
jgi:hypothetical protein